LTIISAGPKLNELGDGSVVSHFISFSGVRLVNSVAAIFASDGVLRPLVLMAVPKIRLWASIAIPRVVIADALGRRKLLGVRLMRRNRSIATEIPLRMI
jgi:hypothetical protein